jgi:hypothetical protein
MVSNFVVANLTSNNNDVFSYDEWVQGKDAMPYVACNSFTIWKIQNHVEP